MEWRRQNTSKAQHKKIQTSSKKPVIDTYVKPEIIKNSFLSTGLCPWNCNATDYSKCLRKMKTNTNPKTKNESIMLYSKF